MVLTAECLEKQVNLHHDERVGGCTDNEYMDVNGTENAYDSALDVGRSIRTASELGISDDNE